MARPATSIKLIYIIKMHKRHMSVVQLYISKNEKVVLLSANILRKEL